MLHVINCQLLASHVPLHGSKEEESLGTKEKVVHYLLATAPQLITVQLEVWGPVISISSDPLRSTKLARSLQDTNMKQAVTAWLQTPETDFFYARIQVHNRSNA